MFSIGATKPRRSLFCWFKRRFLAAANTVFSVRAASGRFSLLSRFTQGGRNSMDMKKRDFLSLAAGIGAVAGAAASAGKAEAQGRRGPNLNGPIDVNQRSMVSQNVQPSTVDWNYKPRRINKAIELWED